MSRLHSLHDDETLPIKFGLSWQIVPTILPKLLQDKDPKKAQRVMQAMLQMKKIDIPGLKKAYEG